MLARGTAVQPPLTPPLPPRRQASAHSDFKCTFYGKSFTSYQALAGHKTSHRKPPANKVDVPGRQAPSNSNSQSNVVFSGNGTATNGDNQNGKMASVRTESD
ncbi:Zinc finger protein AZF1 [Raphanus sativus]|nr:Zinc finger protein AZF1 [Raphanus sativus]